MFLLNDVIQIGAAPDLLALRIFPAQGPQHACRVQRSLLEIAATVLGDPVQAIFGFAGNQLVDWQGHVEARFPAIGALATPWRWLNSGPFRDVRWAARCYSKEWRQTSQSSRIPKPWTPRTSM